MVVGQRQMPALAVMAAIIVIITTMLPAMGRGTHRRADGGGERSVPARRSPRHRPAGINLAIGVLQRTLRYSWSTEEVGHEIRG